MINDFEHKLSLRIKNTTKKTILMTVRDESEIKQASKQQWCTAACSFEYKKKSRKKRLALARKG